MIYVNSSFGQRSRKLNIQDKRFSLALTSGINFSQIDGDYFTGFDQTGISAGLQVEAILSYRLLLSIGMLYSQKGAKIPHGVVVNAASRNDRNIRLNYVEVPILLRSMLNKKSTGSFFEIGGAFARLSNVTIKENDPKTIKGTVYNEIVPEFSKADFNIVAGVGFTVRKRGSITLRYYYGINLFYKNPDFELPIPFSPNVKEVESLRNYSMSILASYRIL